MEKEDRKRYPNRIEVDLKGVARGIGRGIKRGYNKMNQKAREIY